MSKIPAVLQANESNLIEEWMAQLLAVRGRRESLIKEGELREHCTEFLRLLREAAQSGNAAEMRGPQWDAVREMLAEVSRTRGRQGFSPSETASFVFSFKVPLITRLRQAHGDDGKGLFEDVWLVTTVLDKLGLYTTEVHQKAREEVIARQQEEMLELSTPVVALWEGILALPLIGTLDSARTQIVMESLLQKIVETGAEIAIIDITGVPTVDTWSRSTF